MRLPYRNSRTRARGSVAVECAIILPIFIAIGAMMLFLGRIFWHYTVAEKAAHDAARFLASATPREMMTLSIGSEVPIVLAANRIVQEELRELNPGGYIYPEVLCFNGSNWSRCVGIEMPTRIRVRIIMQMADPFFGGFTQMLDGDAPIVLNTVSSVDYVGN